MKSVIFIEGKRIILRPLEMDDLKRCHRWINDPDTRVTLASFMPFNEIAERRFIESTAENKDAVHLAIVLKDGNRHIGTMGLINIRWKDRAAEFGILIGEVDCRSRGYGAEATRLMLDYAFGTLNLNRVQLGVFAENEAGIRAYEKAGFTREGVAREHSFVDGRYVDQAVYAILARDYFKKNERRQRAEKGTRAGKETSAGKGHKQKRGRTNPN